MGVEFGPVEKAIKGFLVMVRCPAKEYFL